MCMYLCRHVPPHRVGFLWRWSENGYTLCPFWSGIGYGFRGNYGSVWTYLSFQFQMSEEEREICEFEMDLKNFFCLHSNLRNDNRIFASVIVLRCNWHFCFLAKNFDQNECVCDYRQDKTRQDNVLFGVLYSPMYINYMQII